MSSEATAEKQYPQIVEQLAKQGLAEITIEEKIHHYLDTSSNDSYFLHRQPAVLAQGNEPTAVFVDFSQKPMKDFLQSISEKLEETSQNHSHNWAICKRERPPTTHCTHCMWLTSRPLGTPCPPDLAKDEDFRASLKKIGGHEECQVCRSLAESNWTFDDIQRVNAEGLV